MNLTIIDYGAGNIRSIIFAIERLGHTPILSNQINEILAADKIIFPGVGEASSAMSKLKQSGLERIISKLTQPVLGICLGMQLMCRHSEENNTLGLDIFDVEVLRFTDAVRVPHIGWNTISQFQSSLFGGIDNKSHMYFAQSYYVPLCEYTTAISDYDGKYSAALQKDNFYGVQFHPEKSSQLGSKIIENFINL